MPLLAIGCQSQTPSIQNEIKTERPIEEKPIPLPAQGALTIPTQETTGSLNVHSSRFGIVYRDEDSCYADIETTSLSVPSADEPETIQRLECTPFMKDPAWQRCLLKEILRTSSGDCRCNMPGAPIEEANSIPCPILQPITSP